MFDFNEELKYYEPGLELIEDSLSGQEEKDLVELMGLILQARTGEKPVMDRERTPEVPEEVPAETPEEAENKEEAQK